MRATSFPFALETVCIDTLDFDAVCVRLGLEVSRVRVITGQTWSKEVALVLASRVRGRRVEVLDDIDNTLAQHRSLAESNEGDASDVLVVGVGGGCVLDLAKYHACRLGAPYLAVPTIISNDGIASPIAILRGDDDQMASHSTTPPLATLIDRGVLERAPHAALVSGIGDVLSNRAAVLDWDLAIERGRATPNALARIMSRSAVQNVLGAPPNLRDDIFFERYIDAIVLSGLAMYISGDSRPCSGAEHLIAHAINRARPGRFAHGLLVGSIAPFVVWLHDRGDRSLWSLVRTLGLQVDFMRLVGATHDFASLMNAARRIRGDRFTVLDISSNEELEREYHRFVSAFSARQKRVGDASPHAAIS
ncbi:MAG: iron-containing alcohol dehydrogenase [Myxococcota bacterium]|jgi:glycerol-1-phosphate dehydrogenase [NAD(P)+]|nr:iron-containing alcohol dehydrogenase [Myxococcota bacterium]